MSILDTIKSFFQPGSSANQRFLTVYILNFRCNEPISAQIDLYNDLSPAEEGRKDVTFFVRKVLSTSGTLRCYDSSEVQVWLDGRRRVVEYEVTGGKWLEAEAFEEEMAKFQQRTAKTATEISQTEESKND